mmetsp:Transcript_56936/g.123213  ORF Transcript_56936/g.123213 Transcript_56936/m.123213 type:complete len:202 (-) Transcript_56936:91-696(-)|eukprot:CAMPEP_0170616364 /NCGR_PEP_ID=MMETSP0224-20130122/25831_1 /TAXON_ID=285029 /ORGANISM="Togula jolla, Strain CCCM 725" /LENGTH=201 /DNA_ID=CAMNT_0010942157 /DNA_START=60 /DNA_END=665 /DNA_ORIENTATION=+
MGAAGLTAMACHMGKDKALLLPLLGLDGAGKTEVLQNFKLDFAEEKGAVVAGPTIGINITKIHFRRRSFDLWDVSGAERVRRLWPHYCQGAGALIFVVDSSDITRIAEASEELHRILGIRELRNVPLLILANKQDKPGAMTPEELGMKLQLGNLRAREWLLQPSCALSGDGLNEAFEWLIRARRHRRTELSRALLEARGKP